MSGEWSQKKFSHREVKITEEIIVTLYYILKIYLYKVSNEERMNTKLATGDDVSEWLLFVTSFESI